MDLSCGHGVKYLGLGLRCNDPNSHSIRLMKNWRALMKRRRQSRVCSNIEAHMIANLCAGIAKLMAVKQEECDVYIQRCFIVGDV